MRLNWFGCRNNAELSEISRASFSLLKRAFLDVIALMSRSRRVEDRALYSRFATSIL